MNRMNVMLAVLAVNLVACGGPAPEAARDAGMQLTGGGVATATGGGAGSGTAGVGGGTSEVVDAGVDAGMVTKTITVSGTVINNYGQISPSSTVVLIGKGSTTSNSQGAFTFTNVTPPYDIAVMSGVNSTATIYKGLTRTDPRLRMFDTSQTFSPSSAALTFTPTGNVMTGDAKTDIYSSWRFAASSADDLYDGWNSCTMPSSGTRTCSFEWWSQQPVTGSFHLLQRRVDKTTLFPSEYAYGHTDNLTLANKSSMTFTTNLGAVDTGVMNVNVTLPSGGKLTGTEVLLELPNDELLFVYNQSTSASTSVKVPKVPGLRFVVRGWANDNGGNEVFAEQRTSNLEQPVNLKLPAYAPRLSLPIDNAAGIDPAVQKFSWVAIADSTVTAATFETQNFTVRVVTSGSQLEFPSTSELGLGTVPTGSKVTWALSSYTGAASVDEVVAPTRKVTAVFGTYQGRSQTRTFTTK